jgi:hypothetical protein
MEPAQISITRISADRYRIIVQTEGNIVFTSEATFDVALFLLKLELPGLKVIP